MEVLFWLWVFGESNKLNTRGQVLKMYHALIEGREVSHHEEEIGGLEALQMERFLTERSGEEGVSPQRSWGMVALMYTHQFPYS